MRFAAAAPSTRCAAVLYLTTVRLEGSVATELPHCDRHDRLGYTYSNTFLEVLIVLPQEYTHTYTAKRV